MRALKLRGVEMRSISEATRQHVDEQRVRQLFAAGMGRRRIAEELGCGAAIIARVFRDLRLVRPAGRVKGVS